MRHILAKQHLLPGQSGRGVVRVADDVVGLHATLAATPYLSLLGRLPRFTGEDLERALYEDRSLVRLRGMRGTVFVFSRRLAPIVFAATSAVTLARDRRWLGLEHGVYERWAPRVVAALRGRSLGVGELRRELSPDANLSAVVALLCDEGRVVRDRPVGGRRSSAFRYRLWEETLPNVVLAALGEREATRALVRAYVARYGPVTPSDVMWWSGIPTSRIRGALADLNGDLAEVRVGDLPERFLMTRDDLARLVAVTESASGGIALLPELDPYTMGYQDRERFLDPRQRDLVFDRGGNATSVVLLDGRVAGVWDLADDPEPAVRVLLFEPGLPQRDAVYERAAAVGQFWFGRPVPVRDRGTDLHVP